MTDFTNSIAEEVLVPVPVRPHIYFAVYDSCVTNHIPSRDLAFIEERQGDSKGRENVAEYEKHFPSLKEAKIYAKIHFDSGAEYFSLKQTKHPDNFFYIFLDKLCYMFA